MKNLMSVFALGFIQVYFISVNTYFIAHKVYSGVLIAAFLISLVWSFNVKKVALGTNLDRFAYSIGAAIGSLSGLATSDFIVSLLVKFS